MIHTAITKATDEVPKIFENGWHWWAWPIAWATLALAALIIATAAPLFALTVDALEGSAWRVPAAIGVVALALAAVGAGYVGSGVMMRHMDSGGGAFWVFIGSIVVGLIGWAVSAHLYGGVRSYDYPSRRGVAWISAAPALVIGLGAVFNGIAEIITRLAASIPMSVAQFGAILVFGVIGLGLFLASPSRR